MGYTRWIVIWICFCSAQAAPPKNLLACLGREELKIHRSGSEGPLYRLNRTLVNALAGMKSFAVPPEMLEKICRSREYSPSVALLRELLLSPEKNPGWKLFVTKALDIFFDYMTGLQSLAPTADCLTRQVPDLKRLRTYYKYLQKDGAGRFLASERAAFVRIFEKIKKLDEVFQRCRSASPPKKP